MSEAKRPRLSRRHILQLTAAGGVLGVAGAAGYGAECLRAAPPPKPRPGAPPPEPARAPLLVVAGDSAANPFGRYLGEILRAEGLNLFRLISLSALAAEDLSGYALILLGETPLTADQADRLRAYVTAGGQLVAMRPDERLADLGGVALTGGEMAGGYLQTVAGQPLTAGLAAEPLQFHGSAWLARLAGAEALAWLQAAPGQGAEYPALTWHRAGAGAVVLWAFDLARSVALTRQGNPAWANQERDGLDGVRAADMFVDWLDLERVAIPQADEQQRLLLNVIQALCEPALPLPRLGYFPAGAGAVLVATGDSHENMGRSVAQVLERAERFAGRMSIYYSPPAMSCARRVVRQARWWAGALPLVGERVPDSFPLPRPAEIAAWRERGHEFTFHPFVEAGVEAGYLDYWTRFHLLGYGPVSATTRTHRILWQGWAETARVQAAFGIGLNLDYYHVGPAFLRPDGTPAFGHLTGSGLPLKFVDEQGQILDVFQQNTQLVDEHMLDALGGRARLSVEQALAVARDLLDLSLRRYPAALGAQFHVDPFELGGPGAESAGRWLEGVLALAAERGVPVLPAAPWLAFCEARHAVVFEALAWDGAAGRLSFEVVVPPAPFEFDVLVPQRAAARRLTGVSVAGSAAARTSERQVGAVSFAVVRVAGGRHTVSAQYAP
ncbi:MAG: hypothetical protein JNK29_19080 [Anaerolineales bacterium]|nr:hypothetical protein [Anaerolineales bacterium]